MHEGSTKTMVDEALQGMEYEERPECHIQIFDRPLDLPKGIIAYNPGNLQRVLFEIAGEEVEKDVIPARVESDRNDSGESHLGKTVSRIYYVNDENQLTPVWTLFRQEGMTPEDEAELERRYDVLGEDPSFKLMPMKQADGSIEEQWMLSTVVVEAATKTTKAKNGKETTQTVIKKLATKFYFADSLEDLSDTEKRKELTGPVGMKDIRICPITSYDDEGNRVLRYMIYGRPQGVVRDAKGGFLRKELGNITFAIVDSLDEIETPEVRQQLKTNFLKPDLFPGDRWGGANDAIQLNETTTLVLAHDAQKTGEKRESRYYTPVLLIHNFADPENPLAIELGPIASPESFPSDEEEFAAKADQYVDLRTVVFPGGFSMTRDSEGRFIIELTAGYRDSRIAKVTVRLTQKQSELINRYYDPNIGEQFELAA